MFHLHPKFDSECIGVCNGMFVFLYDSHGGYLSRTRIEISFVKPGCKTKNLKSSDIVP